MPTLIFVVLVDRMLFGLNLLALCLTGLVKLAK